MSGIHIPILVAEAYPNNNDESMECFLPNTSRSPKQLDDVIYEISGPIFHDDELINPSTVHSVSGENYAYLSSSPKGNASLAGPFALLLVSEDNISYALESPKAFVSETVRLSATSETTDGDFISLSMHPTCNNNDVNAMSPSHTPMEYISAESQHTKESEGRYKSCSVTFKGVLMQFSDCRKGLAGDFEVYWTTNEKNGEINTLLRAPNRVGYVGFGWGSSEMIGSNVAVASLDKSGNAMIKAFESYARSPEGVVPSNRFNMTETDAETSGSFLSGLFTRKLIQIGASTIVPGGTRAIWAADDLSKDGATLSYHQERGSSQFYSFAASTDPTSTPLHPAR